ncbi:hypothetical protein JN11_04233 [Mucilaginibacter frigoritolerans]|uniref:Uncharacterized protein n=2 Tax=Mucilaginibacter frigoritolerans TaxID=652788 RepID=A0A562TRT4_9SPHI|nr:hypothetical protein JN11_04233 [Mucilaginibacter frigoritolerans]
MHRQSRFIILVSVLLIMSCNNIGNQFRGKETVNASWKKIPDSWIKKATQFTYKKPDTTLLSEFAKFIKPDTLNNPHAMHVDPDYGFVFNIVRADLDGDGNDELLCLQGWDVSSPSLCVFKQVNNNWYLIYMEEIDTFYNSPTLYIANNYSRNKTFYLRRVYDHGSGIYIDGYSFYKLTNNHVYKCLDIINDAHIYGWGLYLNQSVKSTFEFDGDSDDDLSVDYTYNFFPGSIYKSDCPWCAHEDLPLINGEENMDYVYNNKEHKYKLDIPKYENKADDLTAEKIACFADFGNDSLFVKAFRRHIDTTLKIGTPLQKKILRKYLSLVDKNKTVITQ